MKNKKDYDFLLNFVFNGQNLLLQHIKISNKNFFRYVKNPVSSCHIGFPSRVLAKIAQTQI